MSSTPQAPAKLPLSLKLAFGAPAFAGAAMGIPIGVLMPKFYSDVVLAPLGYIAIAIALARGFDALTDPVMGWLSDRTHSRWGRRRPYIALGTPFAALAFYFLFAPPTWLSSDQAALWFGVTFCLFFLFSTIVEIPFAALGAELTPDYTERSSLFGYRSFFVAFGMMAAAVFPSVLRDGFGFQDERLIFLTMARLYALILVALIVVMLTRVRERPDFVERESNPLIPGVRRALRNKPFRILLIAGIISSIPAAIPVILMPYFVEYVLQPSNPTTLVGLFLLTYLGAGMLMIPVWMLVAKRLGKLRTLILNSVIGITGSAFYFFLGPGDVALAGTVYFATGMVSMAGTFLVPAMAADVIDYDELRTGKRREAQFTSFWALIPKFVAIPGSSVPLAVLAAVGYVPNQAQAPDVLFTIRFLYSLFPVLFHVIALMVVTRYPISEEIHRLIRQGIDAHGRGETAVDPLTHARIEPFSSRRETEESGWFLDHFSPGELRSALSNGAASVFPRVISVAVASLALSVGAAGFALVSFQDAGSDPALRVVFAVVAAGLAFTAFVFHALRLRPARQLTDPTYDEQRVAAHLAQI